MTTSKWASEPALINSSGRVYSFAKSAQWIRKLSAEITCQNRRVGVLIHNRLYSGIVSLAGIEENLCIPLDTRLKDEELLTLIREASISVLIVDKMFHLTRNNLLEELEVSVLLFDEGKGDPVISHLSESHSSNSSIEDNGEGFHGLMLLTSGTTGKSKQVFLCHSNLKHGIKAVGESLFLDDNDRAVNMLPMIHIGGILDLLLAPLFYGCSVLFLEASEIQQNSNFITDKNVTWVQGSPAILQHLLRVVDYDTHDSNLRLIRSVSAPLADSTLHELEQFFGVPVVEIYGMSETTGVITSNPISREERKIGSVGQAVKAEISIRNQGEIWVRSAGVFSGYLNVEKNSKDWDGDWFHTGDVGRQDEDGFLFLIGRKKDQINKGGQKVFPAEIDRIMGAWDEVSEAASFGFSHASLGEEVAVAIVLKPGERIELDDVKSRLGEKLADFKLPCKVIYLDSLPRNKNGKLQRDKLVEESEKLVESEEYEQYDDTEILVQSLFCKVLGVDKVGLEEDFFEMGGDSLSAVSLVSLLEKNIKMEWSDFRIFEHSSVKKVSLYVRARSKKRLDEVLVNREIDIRPALSQKLHKYLSNWQGLPVFPGAYGIISNVDRVSKLPYLFFCGNGNQEYDVFAKAAEGLYQVVGFRTLRRIQHKWFRDLDRLAEAYAHDIMTVQNDGPYHLGGYCEGANIMIRVAEILIQINLEVRQFICHDYIVDKPINTHVSMLFSEQASMNQLRFYYDVERGWRKLFRGKYGFIELKGGHNRYGEEGFSDSIRPFLVDELHHLGKAQSSMVQSDEDHRKEYEFDVKVISSLPRVLKVGQQYALKLLVTNKDSRALHRTDGYAVHARWIDLAGDHKFSKPMRAQLKDILASGDSDEVEILVVPHKKKRLYKLEVAVIEEGYHWSKKNNNYLQKWYLLV